MKNFVPHRLLSRPWRWNSGGERSKDAKITGTLDSVHQRGRFGKTWTISEAVPTDLVSRASMIVGAL